MNLSISNEHALCLFVDWFQLKESSMQRSCVWNLFKGNNYGGLSKTVLNVSMLFFVAEQCVYPDPPHLGTRTYEMGYYPYFGCTIGCTDANRRIDRDTPKVYTCGPSGAWSPYNRNIPLRFPSCGCESFDE